MELPLGGPVLRHYTRSRPRPHRQNQHHRPSRTQDPVVDSENEAPELNGRVDEGVEEFFTKRLLPADTLKQQDEEVQVVEPEVAPASAAPCPAPSRTLRKKLGEFFTLRKRRGLKSETSQEGRTKKTSIADLIRPLRDAARAEKDKLKEHDKDKEREKEKESDVAVIGESVAVVTESSGPTPLRGEAQPRRVMREGKSQSLILLSGSTATSAGGARNTTHGKKHSSEGQHSFEQKLHLMLQRIGVSKAPPEETQSQEGEMKKAESEGTIIDNKPDPTSAFMKPRTMSTSSDTRRPIRLSASAHEAAGKPALPPKPLIKSGSGPAHTSGRNTPENELTQIQEGETSPPAPSPHGATATHFETISPTSSCDPSISNSTAAPIPTGSPTPCPTSDQTNSITPILDQTNSITPILDKTNSVTPTPDQTNAVTPTPDQNQTNSITPSPEKTNSSSPDQTKSITPTPDQPNSSSPDETNTITPTPDETNSTTPTPNQTNCSSSDEANSITLTPDQPNSSTPVQIYSSSPDQTDSVTPTPDLPNPGPTTTQEKPEKNGSDESQMDEDDKKDTEKVKVNKSVDDSIGRIEVSKEEDLKRVDEIN
ncbi:capping protein, Arp2/3 and myosin-I linker protein 2-like [Hypomesus transpacificus]|uniref:capping protein, Arp2/3 and myosin-I linker protein 2-like n=1 Tax=Hypomesus transpacificus TaxID=137520 RepID=UPI001F0829A6|nr:capping protein, Arp2/3 and myosin-I linker protein 2-like [Hypomesus transpacificus]